MNHITRDTTSAVVSGGGSGKTLKHVLNVLVAPSMKERQLTYHVTISTIINGSSQGRNKACGAM